MRETGDILRPLIRIGDGPDACWEWTGKKLRVSVGLITDIRYGRAWRDI